MKRTIDTMLVLGVLFFLTSFIFPAKGLASTYDTFNPCFKDISGWQAEKPEGMNVEMPGMKMLSATRTYSKGDKNFTVAVSTGPMANITLAGNFQVGTKIETPDGLMKVEKIKGFIAQTVYDKSGNSGSVTVVLKKDEAQDQSGAMLMFTGENMNLDEVLELAKTFDWQCFHKKAQSAR